MTSDKAAVRPVKVEREAVAWRHPTPYGVGYDFSDEATMKDIADWLAPSSPQDVPIAVGSDVNNAWPNGEVRLWDSQWVNCVNHDNCYFGWDKQEAIAHAVKMTERYMRENYENSDHAAALEAARDEVERLRYEAGLKEETISKSAERTAFALSRAEAAERRVAALVAAATQASATLSHIYHTVPLPREVEREAYADYQRLDEFLETFK